MALDAAGHGLRHESEHEAAASQVRAENAASLADQIERYAAEAASADHSNPMQEAVMALTQATRQQATAPLPTPGPPSSLSRPPATIRLFLSARTNLSSPRPFLS